MEEIVQSLEASAQTIEGVEMVPLAAALQALQASTSSIVLKELQQALAGLKLPMEDDLSNDLE